MAKCSYCGTTILFGGKRVQDFVFCNDQCLGNGQALIVSRDIPDDLVLEQTRRVHSGACPVCGASGGPVDVHTAHKVTSFLVMTSWSSQPRVSCRSCGTKAQLAAAAHSLFLGWWGFPWGLMLTPVQVARNLMGLMRSDDPLHPSPELENIVRLSIANHAIAASQDRAES